MTAFPTVEPEPNEIYEVELCSGEYRRWRYLGPDSLASSWWRDEETGHEFNEAGLMYVWRIVRRHESPATKD